MTKDEFKLAAYSILHNQPVEEVEEFIDWVIKHKKDIPEEDKNEREQH